jgi:TonB-dependent starch-binding outer membrane protein SusC
MKRKLIPKKIPFFKSTGVHLLILIFLLSPGMMAQNQDNNKIVSGKVTDKANDYPLPGVNIYIKGTSEGTISDLDGNYELNVPAGDVTLVFSFIGYKQQEVVVRDQSVINISLEEQVKGLEEVVVVGYGSLKKRDIVGSVSTVDSEDLKNGANSASFVDFLQGKAAGLSIQSTSGVPGAQSNIKIRGLNSLHAGTEPLWIIDGVPVYNYAGVTEHGTQSQSPMSLINPNDIKSIQVLKDASATAIYGSRGSNGIILVTTKSGEGAKESGINVNYSTGISELSRTPDDIGYCNTSEWFSILDVASENEGDGLYNPQYTYNRTPYAEDYLTREQALAVNTDWFDHILQNGSYHEVNFSSTSAFDKGNIYLSGNYRKDNSVIKYSSLERFSMRGNFNYKATKNLRLGSKINLSHTRNNRMRNSSIGSSEGNTSGNAGGFTTAGHNALPWYPVYNDSSEYYNPLVSNPVAFADPDNRKDYLGSYRAIGSLSAEYSVPFVKGLSVKTENSFDIIQSNQTNWVSEDVRDLGSLAREEAVLLHVFNSNLYSTLNREWGKHSLVFTLGMEGQRNGGYERRMEGWDIQGTYQEMGSPLTLQDMYGGMAQERYLLSYFSRVNYKFMDKYILGLSFRRDGSSKFPEEKRWGNFAALSLGWILTEEKFMSFLGDMTFLKLRSSFGQTGNESIPSYLFVQTYRSDYTYGSQDIMGRGGTLPSNMVSGMSWEKTSSFDGGLDFGFLNNRISGSVAYYYKMVDNLLLNTPLPISTGIDGGVYNYSANQAMGNIGRLDNSGFEFEISSVNINRGGFKWSTMFNFGTNKSIVKRLDNQGNNVIDGYRITAVGNKINEWYMARFVDVDSATGVERILARDQEYYDETGITRSLKSSDGSDSLIYASRTNIQENYFRHDGKNSTPTFYGGITNNIEYKGFDFSFFISFSGGNYIYDYNEQVTSTISPTRVLRKDVLNNYWEKEGDIAKYPRPKYVEPHTVDGQEYDLARTWCGYDKYLYKGDYMKLKNIQLGYSLPTSVLSRLRVENLRIYASASNLLTITDYKGWDPEGATQVYEAVIPQLRMYTLGLDLSF